MDNMLCNFCHPLLPSRTLSACPNGQFACVTNDNTSCVNVSAVCDGYQDCPGGYDETDCGELSSLRYGCIIWLHQNGEVMY